jgi:hypothetical protein
MHKINVIDFKLFEQDLFFPFMTLHVHEVNLMK